MYAPDYIINAGGLIQVACEIDGGNIAQYARSYTEEIFDTIQRVLTISQEKYIPTSETVDNLTSNA